MGNSVTVEYKDYDTKVNIIPNEVYDIKEIVGYDPVIVDGEDNKIVSYYFKQISGSVTISYIDNDTGVSLIPNDKIENLQLGSYSYSSKTIDGKDLVGNEIENVEITAVNREIIIQFKYKNSYYLMDINKFGVKNDGTSPVETSQGINSALKFAQLNNYTKVMMPPGVYCISELNPIIMLDNITLDLNGATFKINTNELLGYNVVNFTACKNSNLINGTILGDRYTHDYTTIKGTHEWGCGIIFNDCESCGLDSVTVKSVTGYGITSSLGKNISNLSIGITVSNLQIGKIDDNGTLNSTSGTIRTINPIDISHVGGQFELGYNKGYMGYPYMQANIYDAYFYDSNKKIVSIIKGCKQYKKVIAPMNSNFVHFVFYQITIPIKGDSDFNETTVFITNYISPYKITIANCLIDDNRSLGMGLCGGREFLIEGNVFSNNKGNAPGYAIDLEDGWEYMDKYMFRNNKFIANSNDIVSCAGDNITFDGNNFTSTVYMWGRTTNYSFTNNTFTNINMNINYEYSTDTICTGNIYTNCKIVMTAKNNISKITIDNEKLINTTINGMSSGQELTNSQVSSTTSIRLAGVYRKCIISNCTSELISSKMYDCTINKLFANNQVDCAFSGCIIRNSVINTTTNTKSILIEKCNITDTSVTINTWGNQSSITMQNNTIGMSTGTNAIVNMSAGKTSGLLFINNTVNNQITKPVINMYDAIYTTPNGNVTISNNIINQSKYAYVFDGVNIGSGLVNLNYSKNTITGAQIINPKYLANPYFKVIVV